MTLASLFVLANIMFMFDKTDKMSTHKDIHAHNTRGNQNIVVPKFRLNTTTSSHIVMSVKLFNKLPSEIKAIKSIDTFKLKVKAILLGKKNFYTVQGYMDNELLSSQYLSTEPIATLY